MTDEELLLRAIQADPSASLPRLVYADWLDEHGEGAKAKYLRLEAEFVDTPLTDTRHRDRLKDLSVAARELHPSWINQAAGLPCVMRGAWEPLANDFSSSIVPPSVQGHAEVVVRMLQEIGDVFENTLPMTDLKSRFCLPADYLVFQSAIGLQSNPNAWKAMIEPSGVANATRIACERSRARNNTKPELWIHFCFELGVTEYYLCCDLDSSYFGAVAESNLSPWMEAVGSMSMRGATFTQFISEYGFVSRNWSSSGWPALSLATWRDEGFPVVTSPRTRSG